MTAAKMSERQALQYIATSPPDSPIFQKALIALNRRSDQKKHTTSLIALAVSITSFAVGVVTLMLKIL
jgi:hypothetical protein